MIQIGMLTLIFLNEIQKLQNTRKLTYSMLNDMMMLHVSIRNNYYMYYSAQGRSNCLRGRYYIKKTNY